MTEIGSFLELELGNTGEYYADRFNVIRLNTGRSCVFHALQLLGLKSIYIPYYLCPTVKQFLVSKGIHIFNYSINRHFEPELGKNDPQTAVLIVNYFGIISNKKMEAISRKYNNVIIDNCPAFFSRPIEKSYNIYSARKFFGVADGSYVIGDDAQRGMEQYEKDSSSDTSAFLLKRIEKGCQAVYAERMVNETRLDQSDIMLMSDLTCRILQSIDYEKIKIKRKDNFDYAHHLFGNMNLIDPLLFMDKDCVPMVYPLVVENTDMMEILRQSKIYTGRWWNAVLKEVSADSFEAFMSKYMLPVPIDQRYGKEELDFIFEIVRTNNH